MSDNERPQSITYGQPAPYTVGKVIEKKTLDSGARIFRLRLKTQAGDPFWAEMFCRAGTTPPAEGNSNLIITEPDNPKWDLKAALPGGFRGKGGGGFKANPVEDAARQAMIIAQSARTAALEEIRLAGSPNGLGAIRAACDERVKEITAQALALGDAERGAARGRR